MSEFFMYDSSEEEEIRQYKLLRILNNSLREVKQDLVEIRSKWEEEAKETKNQ